MQVSSKTSLHRRPACVLPWHGGNGNHQVRIDFIFTTIIILIVRSKWGVLVFSWSAGIMYQIMLIHLSFFSFFSAPHLLFHNVSPSPAQPSNQSTRYSTLFTMPYLLVAHYHETDSIQCEDSWFLRQIRALLRSIQVNSLG